MKIRVLHGKGWSASRIAKELERPVMTVTRTAAKMGMFFDHAQTAAATAASAIDQRARRARLAARLLADSEELLDDLKRPYLDHTFAANGEYTQHAAMPTPQDKAHLTRAAVNLMGEHRRMADFDAEDGAAAAKSLLGQLGEALGAAAANLEDEAAAG
jgi:hypothetical protein